MAVKFPCGSCGRQLRAKDEFVGKRAECPYCGSTFSLRRMFEALLDPRSIQWMLTLGGGLCVLGLIVWLTSLGIFENKLVLASVMGIGSLAILGGGWWVSLKTRFRVAGQALTFLGCVVAPLNLWFYAHVDLVSVDDHLWVGGLICCLLYAATVYVLRDPLFVYAVEAGATLTLTLLLATLPLVIAVVHYRFFGPADAHFSALDEMGLFAVTVALLVTGYSWQIKSTTFFGGASLTLYLIIIVVSLGWQQQLAADVYLAVGGAVLFALGIMLSMYREKLLQLPERIAKREGVFRMLNWR